MEVRGFEEEREEEEWDTRGGEGLTLGVLRISPPRLQRSRVKRHQGIDRQVHAGSTTHIDIPPTASPS